MGFLTNNIEKHIICVDEPYLRIIEPALRLCVCVCFSEIREIKLQKKIIIIKEMFLAVTYLRT